MEIKDLKSLIKMVTETDITEFKMENKEEKILIKRGPDKEFVHMSAPAMVAPITAAPAPVVAPAANTAAAPSAAADANAKCDAIPSPIVGTFYRKPSPA